MNVKKQSNHRDCLVEKKIALTTHTWKYVRWKLVILMCTCWKLSTCWNPEYDKN